MKASIHTDGACSGNPGESGIGAVIELDGKAYEISRYIGHTTNNVAEYTALIEALDLAYELKAETVEIMMDSELIVRQLTGRYQVKTPHIASLYREAIKRLWQFKSYTIRHIPREENSLADSLARLAVKKRADQTTAVR